MKITKMSKYYNKEAQTINWFKITRDITLTIIGTIILLGSVGTIGAGERGVVTKFGAVTGEIKEEGLYFKVPIIQKVIKMDVQTQKDEVSAGSASSDLQTVNTIVALNYKLNSSSVATIYQELRTDYNTRVIAPSIQESVKSATALFTAEELITKRAEVRDEIQKALTEKLEKRGITVEALNIVNFSFSSSFDEAIEKKVTAEQDALASKNKLEQIKFEAQQKVEEAKGKAEAIRIESDALRSNPAVLELRALEKWDGVMPQVTGGATPFINLK